MLASIAKVFFLLADYVFGYLFQLAPAMMRSDMIIFDRYLYDLLVDSRRVRYGGPRWLLRLAASLVPRPDLVILLDAPAEVLWSRKQEVTFEEVTRQRAGYLEVASDLPQAVVIDAAQLPTDVAGSALAAIVEFYSMRTARRLVLGKAPVPRIQSKPRLPAIHDDV
jgi:thymidylate kinase